MARMTLEQALSIPKGMTFEEYGKLLERFKRASRRIELISNDIHFEENSLEVLEDEKGSERYNRHLQAKKDAETRLEKAYARYNEIERQLKGE